MRFLRQAEEIDRHPTVKRFAALAKELGVVLPVSVFERAGNAHYNTTVIVDADGRELGIYRRATFPMAAGTRRSSISRRATPDLKVWTRQRAASGSASAGTSGPRMRPCHGADGSGDPALSHSHRPEPPNPDYDSSTHWQNTMCGHAAANIMPLMASNRVGRRPRPTAAPDIFYGRSFIADYQGEKLEEMDRTEEGVRLASFDMAMIRELRRSWGVFRDRRPELYGALMTLDGKTKSAAT